MMIRGNIQRVLTVGLGCVVLGFTHDPIHAKENGFEAVSDAIDAYVYGYPLVTMEMTRRVMTNVRKPDGARAPMGQFLRMRHYPDANYRDVTAPNADTLYTTAWIDVGKEPRGQTRR